MRCSPIIVVCSHPLKTIFSDRGAYTRFWINSTYLSRACGRVTRQGGKVDIIGITTLHCMCVECGNGLHSLLLLQDSNTYGRVRGRGQREG